MKEKRATKSLSELATSLLIGEGEFLLSPQSILTVPFDRKKSLYLSEVIKTEQINDFIEINSKKGQFCIHSHSVLESIKAQWYNDSGKIFSFVLDPKILNLKSIVMCINLFGERKLESISIPTNIEKNHIKTLAYCMEKHLKVPVIPGTKNIKVTNIPSFILNCINEIPAIHSAELVHFLTEKEKKKVMEGEIQ